jgi:small subunit ribosomal protein S3
LGQKTNPVGFRLGVTRTWNSRWFARNDFAKMLNEDIVLRRYLERRLRHAAVSLIGIERRSGQKVDAYIYTARPGVVIGKKGEEVERLRKELHHLTRKEVGIKINEIRSPEIDAQLVADNIARQLEKRVAYRRAIKRAIQSAMRMGAQGIKIECGGRLNGAEIARREKYKEGRVPLHTLRANIDYARSTSHTTYGCIGIKVWICKGEILGTDRAGEEKELRERPDKGSARPKPAAAESK